MGKFPKKVGAKKPSNKPSENSFLKGTLVGLLVSAAGSIITGVVQYHYTRQQQETQLFLDEKKEFVLACNDYLTQYRNWHELMQYYAAKDSVSTKFSEYTPATAKAAYYKWKNDIDVAYGKMYLVSDNEFGIKTVFMSQALTRSLQAFATTDTLTVAQRYAQATELTIFFQQHWLFEARRQILSYNSGQRRQRSDEEFLQETGGKMEKMLATDTSRVWNGDSTEVSGSDMSRLLFPE